MVFDDKSMHGDNSNAVSIIKNPVVCPICKSNNVITDPESGERSYKLHLGNKWIKTVVSVNLEED